MKITILPSNKAVVKPDQVTLFNLVKRCEEDLRILSPSLQEFIVSVVVHPTFVGYHKSRKATYKIDDQIIELFIDSYADQAPKIIYDMVADKLAVIKSNLREL
jgi:hypothetical protein